jgi:5-dehydro-2-deoxygluconokinase
VTVDDVEAVDYAAYGALITAGTVFAAEPSRSATFRAFELARAAGLPIIFDIDYRPYSWPSPQVAEEVLSRAGRQSDVIVGNDEEFGFMAGAMDKGLDKARALAGQGGGSSSTRWARRARSPLPTARRSAPGSTRSPLKPNGAGDSFMAGLLAGCRKGHRDIREAVLRGSACAAITVAAPAAPPPCPTTRPRGLSGRAPRPDPSPE